MARFTLSDNPLTNYVRGSKEELRKVTWLTRDEVIRDTIVVLSISVAIGLFFAGVDYLLQFGFEQLLQA